MQESGGSSCRRNQQQQQKNQNQQQQRWKIPKKTNLNKTNQPSQPITVNRISRKNNNWGQKESRQSCKIAKRPIGGGGKGGGTGRSGEHGARMCSYNCERRLRHTEKGQETVRGEPIWIGLAGEESGRTEVCRSWRYTLIEMIQLQIISTRVQKQDHFGIWYMLEFIHSYGLIFLCNALTFIK